MAFFFLPWFSQNFFAPWVGGFVHAQGGAWGELVFGFSLQVGSFQGLWPNKQTQCFFFPPRGPDQKTKNTTLLRGGIPLTHPTPGGVLKVVSFFFVHQFFFDVLGGTNTTRVGGSFRRVHRGPHTVALEGGWGLVGGGVFFFGGTRGA